jgi:hypothetical protein
MRIPGLKKYRGRNPGGYFEDLPWEAKRRAQMLLHRFCERWRGNLPQWRRAILIGQAKRLARMSAEEGSAWGRRMLAKRGGYAAQNRYRREGRVGKLHPAHQAALVSATNRRLRKKVKEHGPLTASERHGFGSLHGI